ncbi:30S ribosome-binding factor RbfA [Myxococcota bacterium]|nr:30S ribosome-binding factor RbfA [Myxococcota bacterium]
MADPVRVQRVAEQIRAELSQILRDEVRDPRIRLLTITRVKLAVDLGAATIFYSPLGEDPDDARRAQLKEAMASVAGFLRRQLSRRVELRHTPELRFVLDESIAEGSHMLSLIRALDIKPAEPAHEEEEGDASTRSES